MQQAKHKTTDSPLKIGKDAGAPVIISHHKCILPENFGRSTETLAAIREAATKQSVAFDVYPYSGSSTVLLPARVREDVPIRISWSIPHPEMTGRYLSDIATEWGLSLREAAEKLLPAGAILFQMDEADVQRILADPDSMVCSDGLPHDEFPHPRLWGSFPRVLGHYARDLKIFSMEQAIYKMTGRTAQVFGIQDRGVIREGAYADLVLFDTETVIDSASFDAPTTRAAGIAATWVNGHPTYQAGMADDEAVEFAGRVLRRAD